MAADKKTYLEDFARKLQKVWPDNESVTVACHGHSIPCGYTAENITRPFDAYPHLFGAVSPFRYQCDCDGERRRKFRLGSKAF